jgi:hypothetical protein
MPSDASHCGQRAALAEAKALYNLVVRRGEDVEKMRQTISPDRDDLSHMATYRKNVLECFDRMVARADARRKQDK